MTMKISGQVNKLILLFSLLLSSSFVFIMNVNAWERPMVYGDWVYSDWDPLGPNGFNSNEVIEFGAAMKSVDYWEPGETYWVNVSFQIHYTYFAYYGGGYQWGYYWDSDEYTHLNITKITVKQIGSSTVNHVHNDVGLNFSWSTEISKTDNFSIPYNEGDGLHFSLDVEYDLIEGAVVDSYSKTDICTLDVQKNGPANFTINNPNAAANWDSDHAYNINWATEGLVDYVTVELYKGGVFLETIAENVEDTGSLTSSWSPSVDYVTGSDYYVNISNVDDPLSWSKSDYFTITQLGYLEITSPTAFEHWKRNGVYDITWNSRGDISAVDIKLYDGSTYISDIVDGASNTGTYEWTIPLSVDLDMYNIRIYDSNDAGVYDGSPAFYIDIEDEIYFTAPTSSTEWTAGDTNTLRWYATGDYSVLNLDLYKGGSFVENILDRVSVAPGTNQYNWACDESYSGNDFQFRLYDPDDASFFAWSDEFTYLPPEAEKTLELLNPNATNTWECGTSEEIKWTSTGSIINVKIQLYKHGSLLSTIVESTANDGVYSWNIPDGLTAAADYAINISSTDDATVYDMGEFFTIEEESGTDPDPGETDPNNPDPPNIGLIIGISGAGVAIAAIILVTLKKKK